MAPKKSGGKNKNMCVRLESSECHLFFILYLLWDPGLGLMVLAVDAQLAKHNSQTVKYNFEGEE